MAIRSPITQSQNTSFITDIDKGKVIDQYADLGIDTARFFDNITDISIHQCNDTLYRFYHPFSIFGDDRFYQDLYTHIPDYYYPDRWEYGYALKHIPSKSQVLEIGCGAGIFLEKLVSKGCQVEGLELNSKAITDCRKKGLTVHAELIESYAPKKNRYFDVVCSFQVLEHVTDVKSFLTNALTVLKPGGLMIISVPNSDPYFLKHDKYHTLNLPPHHAGLWSKKSLKKITDFFAMNLVTVKAEPLREYKEWYLVQKRHAKTTRPFVAFLMQLVPRPVYKFVVRLFSPIIPGSYITAIYQKKAT